MASTRPRSLSSDHGRQHVPIPKLKTRDGVIIGHTSPTGGTSVGTGSAIPRREQPLLARPSSSQDTSIKTRPPVEGDNLIQSSSPATVKLENKDKGRKTLRGFLSLKEPSSQALLEYEKSIKKANNGRISIVGMPGISHTKMPSTVPKVNSKWDGIPNAVKERERQQKNMKHPTRKDSLPSSGRSSVKSDAPQGWAAFVGSHSRSQSIIQPSPSSGSHEFNSSTGSFEDGASYEQPPGKRERSNSVPMNFRSSARSNRTSGRSQPGQSLSTTNLPETTSLLPPGVHVSSRGSSVHRLSLQSSSSNDVYPWANIEESNNIAQFQPPWEADHLMPPFQATSANVEGRIDGLAEGLDAIRMSNITISARPPTPPNPAEEVIVISSGRGVPGLPVTAMWDDEDEDSMPRGILKYREDYIQGGKYSPAPRRISKSPRRNLVPRGMLRTFSLHHSPRCFLGLKPDIPKAPSPQLKAERNDLGKRHKRAGTPMPGERRPASRSPKKRSK